MNYRDKYPKLHKKIEQWDITELEIKDFFDNYILLKPLIRDMHINILDLKNYNEATNLFQRLHNIKEYNSIVQKCVPKNKQHLITAISENYINLIIQHAKDKESLRKQFINFFNEADSSEYIEHYLENECSKIFNLNLNSIIDIVNQDPNLKIINSDNNSSLLIKVDSYKALIKIGVFSWCIVREEQTFNSYKSKYGQLYLILNYKKNINDKDYMYGINVSNTGYIGFDRHNRRLLKEELEFLIFEKYKIINNKKDNSSNKTKELQNINITDDMINNILESINTTKKKFSTYKTNNLYDTKTNDEFIDTVYKSLYQKKKKPNTYKNKNLVKIKTDDKIINSIYNSLFLK